MMGWKVSQRSRTWQDLHMDERAVFAVFSRQAKACAGT